MPAKLPARPTKLDALCEQLSALAHQLGPEAKLPTVLQLRDQFGVSVATLDDALGQLEAQNIVVRRHGVGIFVSAKLHQRAICLVQDADLLRGAGGSPFWELLVEQARRRADAGHEAFSLHLSAPYGEMPLHENLMADVRAARVQGILSVGLPPAAAQWLQAQGVPHVAFAAYAPYTVALDGAALVKLGIAALASQGCRRIALWASAGKGGDDQRTHFQQALAAHGLPYLPSLVPDAAPGLPQEQGYHTARRVFGDPPMLKPDGLLITDDMMTLGALVGLQKTGVRVGTDVQIASHANRGSPVLLGQGDVLTRIEVDPAHVVQAMFAMLETLMDGKTPAEPIVWIAPTLRPRRASPARTADGR